MNEGAPNRNLTQEQLAHYDREGYLFLPDYFPPEEIDLMVGELPEIFSAQGEHVVMEKDGVSVRSVYGSHVTNPVYQSLVRHPRLVDPVRQILGGDVYVYQFKVNAKLGLLGDVWEWHQDYIFWLKEDGLPKPSVVNSVIYLDDVDEFSGPILLLPGTHDEGMIDVSPVEKFSPVYQDSQPWISNLTADLKYSIDNLVIRRLMAKYGIVSTKGKRGSVLLFHPNLVHASAPNMSPNNRAVIIISYSHVNNQPGNAELSRPDFLVSRDYKAVQPLPDEPIFLASKMTRRVEHSV